MILQDQQKGPSVVKELDSQGKSGVVRRGQNSVGVQFCSKSTGSVDRAVPLKN
jgi:hypothetical protein